MKGLQLYQKDTSTQSLSCEICKCSKSTLFTEQLQWLILRFNSCFQRSPKQKPVRLSAINAIFSGKNKFAATKIQKQPPPVICKRRSANLLLEKVSSIAKFLRTLILKNICEQLLLKINISQINPETVVQRSSVKNVFSEISKNSQ